MAQMRYTPMAIPITVEPTAMPSLTERLAKLTSTRREVLAAHELARAHMQCHLRSKFTPFKEGDKVWLEATHLHFPNCQNWSTFLQILFPFPDCLFIFPLILIFLLYDSSL